MSETSKKWRHCNTTDYSGFWIKDLPRAQGWDMNTSDSLSSFGKLLFSTKATVLIIVTWDTWETNVCLRNVFKYLKENLFHYTDENQLLRFTMQTFILENDLRVIMDLSFIISLHFINDWQWKWTFLLFFFQCLQYCNMQFDFEQQCHYSFVTNYITITGIKTKISNFRTQH